MHGINADLGARLLLFCLKKNNKFYGSLENKLERDLQSTMADPSLKALYSAFPLIFKQLSHLLKPSIIIFFFKIASSELIFQTELDL